MATLDLDKKGYYLVGWKKFYNKFQALQYGTKNGFNVRWVFNDSVYDTVDWTIPITTSLKDLYKKRALQLREKYDHIVLHYSGGQDSNNILHAFIDNDIHLDKIIMQVPEPQRHSTTDNDTSWENHWAEIDYQAIPYLKQFANQLAKTVIEVQDMAASAIELFSKDTWSEAVTPNASYNMGVVARAMGQYNDIDLLRLSDKGRTSCQLLGIDKPLVYFDGVDYYTFFVDQNAYHIAPVDNTLSDLFNVSVTEFFYWTPDMPEIVVKQSQEIKQACELNHNIRSLFTKTLKSEVGIYRTVMQHLIYDPAHSPRLQTGKPGQNAGKVLQAWFYEGDQTLLNNYEYTIRELSKTVQSDYFVDSNHHKGFSSILSKFYKL